MDLECPYCGFIGDECDFVHYEDSEVSCPHCSEHFRIQEYEDGEFTAPSQPKEGE